MSVLLLCYNRHLATHVRESLRDETRVVVGTFHKFCTDTLKGYGLKLPEKNDPAWANNVAERLTQLRRAPFFDAFDAAIIDEAQDFGSAWLAGVASLLRDPEQSPMWLFADPAQRIYEHGDPLPDWPTFDLTVNCRNTQPIGDVLANLRQASVEILRVGGPEPRFIDLTASGAAIATNAAVEEVTCAVVRDLLELHHVQPQQLVVLCNSRRQVERLAGRKIGRTTLAGSGASNVTVDTVHSFKGLERDVVVYPLETRVADEDSARRLAYVGMSRARAMLIVVGTRRLHAVIRWPDRTCAAHGSELLDHTVPS